jgi:hypothetical protein
MDEHRQVGPPEPPDQAVQPSGVVEVAVAADNGLDARGVDLQAAHVLDHPVGGGAGIEEDLVLGAVLRPSDQDREAVLGQQGHRSVSAFHGGGRLASADPYRCAVGRSLVWHEDVGDVVHERGYGHRVDRLQVEEHPGLEVVQHLRTGSVQMGWVCLVSAH